MLLLYLIVSLGWSLPIFFTKELTKFLDKTDIIIILNLLISGLVLLYLAYSYCFNSKYITNLKKNITKMPKKLKYFIVFLVLNSFIIKFSYLQLLKYNDATIILPRIRALSTIFVLLIGTFVFKEHITFIRVIGIILTLFGVYLIN